MTDDNLDPRRGYRYKLQYQDISGESANDSDYYRLDNSLSLYIPMFNHDTLALNYYQSDAYVRKVGNLDETAIRQELATGCDPADAACLLAEQELVNEIILQRRNGTATSLGGNDRMRGYPQSRFNGGHMAFVGAEYRWNFIRKKKEALDFLVWKDIPTALQLAFFVETGTVSENKQDLWDQNRISYGVGGRVLSASGSIYRADFAFSDEGNEVIVFFYYPWK